MEKKPSLFHAAEALDRLSFQIDNGGEIGEAVVKEFQDLRDDVSAATDRAIYFRHAIKSSIAQVKEIRDEWTKKLKSLERLEESFDNYVLACVRSFGFPLKGEQGAFTSQLNPHAVSYNIPLESKSFTHIMTTTDGGVEPRFMEIVQFMRINTAAVKEALKAGEKLPFAELTQGERVVWKPTPKGIVKT